MESKPTIPTMFWVISIIALVWNFMGVSGFVAHMMTTPEMIAAMPLPERELYEAYPFWTQITYGIGTIGGILGSIALVMKKAWAVPIFLASFIAVMINMPFGMFATNSIEIMGVFGGIVFPVIIMAIAAFLWYYSKKAKDNNWLT